jgi:hypothetical protein
MEELGSYTVRARRQLHSSACCIDRVRAATVGAHLQDDNTINKIHHTRATPLAPDVSHVGREGHPDPENDSAQRSSAPPRTHDSIQYRVWGLYPPGIDRGLSRVSYRFRLDIHQFQFQFNLKGAGGPSLAHGEHS